MSPMNLPRTVLIGVVGGALVAWLVSAETSGGRRFQPLAPTRAPQIEASGAALAAEIARLHDRMHPTIVPQQPARNLFEFSAASRAARVEHPAAAEPIVSEPAPPAPVPPALALIGVAEDATADGGPAVRTAILSSAGQLFFVKEGERAAGRYDVVKIGTDAVELSDSADGRPLRLTLK